MRKSTFMARTGHIRKSLKIKIKKPKKRSFKKSTLEEKKILNSLSPDNNLGLGFYSYEELIGTKSLGTSNKSITKSVDQDQSDQ